MKLKKPRTIKKLAVAGFSVVSIALLGTLPFIIPGIASLISSILFYTFVLLVGLLSLFVISEVASIAVSFVTDAICSLIDNLSGKIHSPVGLTRYGNREQPAYPWFDSSSFDDLAGDGSSATANGIDPQTKGAVDQEASNPNNHDFRSTPAA